MLLPGGGDELHGADGVVPAGVAVPAPPSVSGMARVPLVPSRAGPMMGGVTSPFVVMVVPRVRAWSDSTLPIAASTAHDRPGQVAAAAW
ncbi:MAG: hypothetical protein M3O70_06870 [Actinomycetota bacterium]|nr:hypothetical protein [Actinomycetota bacterium]